MKATQSTNRNLAFDILRIISALSVVVLHASSPHLLSNDVYSANFKIANFINSLSRFGVPIFVMISGAIFLSETKAVSIRKIWCKNILRLFIVYAVWSFATYAFQSLYFWKSAFWQQGPLQIINGCIYSSEHFWFIFMIIGLYALVPLLRTWLHNATPDSLCYFTGLFIVFQVLRTTLPILIDKSLIYKIADMTQITELSGYLGYFVLGYLLTRYELPNKLKAVIYGLVPVGIVVNYFVSNHMSAKQGYYSAGIYDSFGIFTFINVIALFLFVSDITGKLCLGTRSCKIVQNVSLDTLGVYMMHVMTLSFFAEQGILIGIFPLPIEIPVLSIVCFIVCSIISGILRRIPYIGHYLC